MVFRVVRPRLLVGLVLLALAVAIGCAGQTIRIASVGHEMASVP